MKTVIRLFFYFPIVYLLLSGCVGKPVTFESLLLEMVDRDAQARFPLPSYTCRQFSSYDRASVASDQPGWFANWDRSMFIRTEENAGLTEYVMMEAEGPGAIVRFWMTFAGENCGKGILRIYFDNDSIPAVEGGAMDILSGGKLAGEPLSSSVSDSTKYEMRGHNLYLPLPYSQHCKVTYESANIKDSGAKTGGEAVYYNINYRTYTAGTKVITYSADELERGRTILNMVQNKLQNRDRGLDGIKTKSIPLFGKIAAKQGIVEKINGEKAIRSVRLKIKADNLEQALRSTVLSIWFDEEQTSEMASPYVCCPVGDFFGTGYQIRSFDTWQPKVESDGTMTTYWVMPFARNCRIELYNAGEQEVDVSGEVVTSSWNWDKRSMHFGASWHQYTHLQTGEMKNNEGDGGPFDINYVTLKGKGVYVGDAITLFNTVYAWWGEGDEKVYIDGESFPSHIGTGTEDYYGYAWCRPEKFANHPFIVQPDGSGNFKPGYTINARYRALDAIPFNTSLKFDMEMWHWTKATINFAPITFYYMLRGENPNIKIDKDGINAPVVINRTDIIAPEIVNDGFTEYIEGENLILAIVTGGSFHYQNNTQNGWGNNMQAFWNGGKTGDILTLKFVSSRDMRSSVHAVFSLSPDYGKFKITLNGKYVNINLQAKKFKIERKSLGTYDIKQGENMLEVEITETADNEKKTAFFGLDSMEFL